MRIRVVFQFLLLGAGAGVAFAQSQGTFAPTSSLTIPGTSHTAALLPNGKVLL